MTEQRMVEVYKANIPTREGESIQQFTETLRRAVQEKFGKPRTKDKPGVWIYTPAMYSDHLIFERDEEGPPRSMKTWKVTYTRKENGDFQFGTPEEVRKQVAFVPVSKSMEEPEKVSFESVWKGLPLG